MFEVAVPTTTHQLVALVDTVGRVEGQVSDAERIDQLTALERIKSACAAAQARITVDFADSQETVAAAWRERARTAAEGNDWEGWRAAREQARQATVTDVTKGVGRRVRRPGEAMGVAGQVALARQEPPSRGSRHLGVALALVRQMPHTLAALESGRLSEWRATLVVRETAMLTGDQRTAVDTELAEALGDELGLLGDRELVRRVQAISYRIDAESVLARSRAAENRRHVSIRPAPDTMAYVTALLPVAQGVAVHAALTAAAAAARAAGDERSKGQVMADTFADRITGRSPAEGPSVEVQVVMTDRALLDGDDTPAYVPGYGTVPAGWARHLVGAVGEEAEGSVWVRRLFTHPADGTLVAMDSRRRVFDGALRRFLVARDVTCRTPWCDAPIRHVDHVTPHAGGGATTTTNAQGLCVRCNLRKELPGWSARASGTPPDAPDLSSESMGAASRGDHDPDRTRLPRHGASGAAGDPGPARGDAGTAAADVRRLTRSGQSAVSCSIAVCMVARRSAATSRSTASRSLPSTGSTASR